MSIREQLSKFSNEQLIDMILDLQKINDQLKENLSGLEVSLDSLNKENRDLNIEVTELEHDVNILRQENSTIQENNNYLRRTLDEFQQEITLLRDIIRQANIELPSQAVVPNSSKVKSSRKKATNLIAKESIVSAVHISNNDIRNAQTNVVRRPPSMVQRIWRTISGEGE